MKTVRQRIKDLNERRAELLDEAELLINEATKANRDLTAEEQARYDAILGVKDNPGEVDAIDKELGRLKRLEDLRAAQAVQQASQPEQNSRPSFFATPRTHKVLRAFRGENAAEHAHSAGRIIAATVFGHEGSRRWMDEHGIKAVMEEGNNAKGGFLVPTEMAQAIVDLREERGVFRRYAKTVGMGTDHMTVPRRAAGLTAYAVGESDEITASDKQWNQVELTAKKWAVLCKISSELSEDSMIDLADDLASEMAYAFADKEDKAGFTGDGTSTYHAVTGLLNKINDGNHAGSIYTAATGNTAFSTLDLADFEGALGQLPQYAVPNAAWFISRIGYYQSMARLADALGGNRIADVAGGPTLQFLGLPVVISQVLNATTGAQASTMVCAVGDLSLAATLGDRRSFTFASSVDRYFETDQIGVKGTTRFAINVHDVGDGSTAGPVIGIKTPAS